MSNSIDNRRSLLEAARSALKGSGDLFRLYTIRKQLKALRGAAEVNHQFEAPSPHTSND